MIKKLIGLFMALLMAATILSVPLSVSAVTITKAPAGDPYVAWEGYNDSSNFSNKSYLENEKYDNKNQDLGAVYKPTSTKWKVWSPKANSVKLKLYNTGSDAEMNAGVIGTYDMTFIPAEHTWAIELQGDWKNKYYTYLVDVGSGANRVVNETQDVYSWATGVNSARTMVVDLNSTDPVGWENDEHVLFNSPTDAVVWEVHVRDITVDKFDKTSGVTAANQGKYLGFAEGGSILDGKETGVSTGIDYLVENGINCVQLQPVYDFGSVDEVRQTSRNWGYDPMNYNVPEGSYASDAYDGNVRITELKTLIQALHDRGISVIMDVVYNHTYKTSDGCFERTVPGYYYREGEIWDWDSNQNKNVPKGYKGAANGSACGNETASDKFMYRQFMLDSVYYWATEYHMDGFRFDLMALHDVTTMNLIRRKLNTIVDKNNKKIGNKIIMYGEPWSLGTAAPQPADKGNLNLLDDGIGMFNDSYRDAIKGDNDSTSTNSKNYNEETKGNERDKGWVQGDNSDLAKTARGLGGFTEQTGFPDPLNGKSSAPLVAYADSHDNLALWDKLYWSNNPEDIVPGEVDFLRTWQVDTAHDNQLREQLRLSMSTVLMSRGIPFMLAGTEMARSKQGDHNSYQSDDYKNGIAWYRAETYANEVAYAKGLREIRAAYSEMFNDYYEPQWIHSGESWEKGGSIIGIVFTDNTNPSRKLAVVMNNQHLEEGKTVRVDHTALSGEWTILGNGSQAGLKSLGKTTGGVSIPSRSAMILVKGSIPTINNEIAYVNVEHYVGGTLTDTQKIKYHVGDTYHVLKSTEILKDNMFVSSAGAELSGTVTAGTTTVKLNYVPKTTKTLTVKYIDNRGREVRPEFNYDLNAGDDYSFIPQPMSGYQYDLSQFPNNIKGKFSGQDTTIQFNYKPFDNTSVKINYKAPAGWDLKDLCCYAYEAPDIGEPWGEWKLFEGKMTYNQATGYWTITMPAASGRVMFNEGTAGVDQEPLFGVDGYYASGEEVWIENGVLSFKSKQIISHIDINTGERIVADEIIEPTEKLRSNQTYQTTPLTGHGTVIAPNNASGYYTAGVTNILYLYDSSDEQIDTTPPISSSTVPVSSSTTPVITTTTPVITTTNSVNPGSYVIGDANGDNKVTVDDATEIQKHLAKVKSITGTALLAANADEESGVTVADVTLIQKYLAHFEKTGNVGEPAGGGEITTDPTRPTEPDTTQTTEPDTTQTTEPDTTQTTEPNPTLPTDPDPEPEPEPGENSFFVYDGTSGAQTETGKWLFIDGAKLWIYNKDTHESLETIKEYTSAWQADSSTYAYLPELPSGWTNIAIYRTHFEIANLVPVEDGGTNVAATGEIPDYYNLWDNITLQSGGNCYVVTGDGTGEQKVFDYTDGTLSNIGGGDPGTDDAIYFRKAKSIDGSNDAWKDIYVYLFNDSGNSGEWPGQLMGWTGEDDNYHYYKLDVGSGYLGHWNYIVFNDGIGRKTKDTPINGGNSWELFGSELDYADEWKWKDIRPVN
ncbi:MAG: starch-binding protein [Oscillospiraceae bacterium]|nr:starch-binding protein [Oscillospiraceae bacterium]